MSRMQRNRAFTLIELLVVIVIIAVLAAILFPVFASAKGAAKRTQALSNIAQLGKAMHLYLGDNEEHLPFRFSIKPSWPGYHVILLVSGGGGFNSSYAPYIKNSDVWYSPEDRLTNRGYTSFAVNEQLAYSWPLSEIPRPSEAIYLTDRTDVPLSSHGPVDTYVWWQFPTQPAFAESMLPGVIDPVSVATQIDPIRYTGNLGVYLFLDGHAAAMPFDKTWGDAKHNLHLATKS